MYLNRPGDEDGKQFNLPDVANVLGRHIIGRFPFLAISRLVNAQRKRSACQRLLQLGQPSGSQILHLPWSIRDKMVQCLRIALANYFRNGWQGLAFDLGKHPDLNLLEVFKAPHVREHIFVELAIFVDKGHGRSGWSRLGHDCSPLFSTEPWQRLSFSVYSRLDRRGTSSGLRDILASFALLSQLFHYLRLFSFSHGQGIRQQDLRGIAYDFISLTEKIDTTMPGGKFIFHLMGALAEFERDLIRERTNAGLAAAKARGRC